MNCSLNEIEAMGKRAARGAGLSWGLAEEAAKGTRWLAAFGYPGAGVLAGLLELTDQIPAADIAPQSLGAEIWSAPTHRMSPLIAGAALSDCAARLMDRGEIAAENVIFPLLAVPFAGRAALCLGVPVAVQWHGARLVADGRQLSVQSTPEALNARHADRLVFTAPAQMADPRAPAMRADVAEADWARLDRFAHRTFAPATEESRLRGAGAGLTDND